MSSMSKGIAVIGISGRFPGARNIEEYWENISLGKESITFYTEEELLLKGIDSQILTSPNYVKAAPLLDDVEMFDASFFHFSPKEVIAMDPQQRLWLECCWEAIENAGYSPDNYHGSIGVYAGSGGSVSSYLLEYIKQNPFVVGSTGSYHHLGNDKDFLSTRVSFKLNLKGPSMTIQTACSTSLVAVHVACQSLLNGECDMALAGGSTVRIPHYTGYLRMEGDVLSSDGHLRAFDEKADGIVFGSGIGVIFLKLFTDAKKDNDHIYAIIKGTAVNNDGGEKISYTASSVKGQENAMIETFDIANINPEELGYVEAHGTGTSLGDPIEFMALTRVFRHYTAKKEYCAIGSVKNNIGHTEATAGIAGLIKAVLCLYNKKIPPHINFNKPNPKINIKDSPFYITTMLKDWEKSTYPRRAAVNSLGMGGTNAFALLEEVPEIEKARDGNDRSKHILTITAKSENALDNYIGKYIRFLKKNTDEDFGNICFTTHIGRSIFSHRLAVMAGNVKECYMKLDKYKNGEKPEGVYKGIIQKGKKNDIVITIKNNTDISFNVLKNVCNYCKDDISVEIINDTDQEMAVRFKINQGKKNCENKKLKLKSIKGNITKIGRVLEIFMQLFVKGIQINWLELDKNYHRTRTVLPSYPFEKKRFWIDSFHKVQLKHKEVDKEKGGQAEQISSPKILLSEILQKLKDLVEKKLYINFEEVDERKNFLELGLDSIIGLELTLLLH